MRWDLEELTEDAIVSYLNSVDAVKTALKPVAAWSFENLECPAAVVHVEQTGLISEEAEYHDPRTLTAIVAVITDGQPTGKQEPRTLHVRAKSVVLDALCLSTLKALVNARCVADSLAIAFEMAQVTSSAHTTEENKLITSISIECIVQPVSGSTQPS